MQNENYKNNKIKKYIDLFFEFMSKIFSPLIPLLAGSGILKGLLLLFSQLDIISQTSEAYTILISISESIFYFLPILLAFSISKVLDANPYLGALIGASLLHPNIINIGSPGETINFLGAPLIVVQYSSTVIPIILSMILYSYVYRFLQHNTKKAYQIIVTPLLSIIVVVTITLLIIGPVGHFIGLVLARIIEMVMEISSFLTGFIVGGSWATIIGTGFNWAINPIMINNLSVNGYDYIRPFTFASNFSNLGVAIGLFLKTEKNSIKSFAGANVLTIAISGITEPMIYGVLFSNKKFWGIQFLSAALGAGYMGVMGVTANSFIFGSLLTLPALVGDTPSNLIHGLIGLLIATLVSSVLTYLMMKDEEDRINIISER